MRRALVCLAVLAACGGGGQVESEPQSAASPCNVETIGAEAWRIVDAGDFTYCVPRSWRVRDARVTHGGGNLRWARGAAPSQRVAFRVSTVGTRGATPPPVPMRSGPIDTSNELIGGRSARLWMHPGDSRLVTGVEFTEPAMHFVGEASDEKLAEQQWNVFRTVRFKSR